MKISKIYVPLQDYDILEEKVKAVIETYPEFHLTRGKKVG